MDVPFSNKCREFYYNKAAKLIKPPSSDLSRFATSCRSKNLPFDVKIIEGLPWRPLQIAETPGVLSRH